MEITNNQVSQYSYDKNTTSQTNSSNTTNSFDSYLSNTNEKTTTSNNQTSKVVTFIDKYNGFSSLSATDEKIFRDILSDDKLTMEEMQSLTYEQIKKVENLILPNYTTGVSDNEIPIVKVTDSKIGSMLKAVKMTDNEDFNKALFETVQITDNQMERMDFFDRLSSTLGFNDNTNAQKIIYNKTNDTKYLPQNEDWKINDYSEFININMMYFTSLYKKETKIRKNQIFYDFFDTSINYLLQKKTAISELQKNFFIIKLAHA
ncbi:MAG: hypothetical protein K2P52_03260, partial [Campylobacterales bacterium]|nr:hypothetical protein [Campylobacterales bacterium]